MVSVVWLAPGAEAVSEFARQSGGGYLHATCVETAALMCLMAQYPADHVPDGAIGDELQAMVNAWHAADPSVSSQGASNYADATNWLRSTGCHVDENVMSANWWQELQTGIRDQHCVYLVGVTNAQGLPGDEQGVQNHGLAALGIDSNGNILCGDPDNWATQEHMPGDPVGALVTYGEADFVRGQIASLTKVHPVQGVAVMWTQQSDGSGKDAAGHTCGTGAMGYLEQHGLTASDGLLSETFYDAAHSFLPLANERIVTATHNADGSWTIGEQGAQALHDVFALYQAAETALVAAKSDVATLDKEESDLTAEVASLQQQLAQAHSTLSQQAQDALAAMAALKTALAD